MKKTATNQRHGKVLSLWCTRSLFILLTLSILPIASAVADSNFRLGARAGLNGSWITATGSDPRFDFVGGAFVTIPLSDRFSLQPEVLYTRKGGKDSQLIPYIDLNLTADFRFEYIEVPLLVRYAIPTESNWSPYLCAGPSVAFNLSSSVLLETEFGRAQIDIVNMKDADFGLVAGGGTEVALGRFSLVFDLRATIGLANFLKPAEPFVNDEIVNFVREDGTPPELENGAISFTVGAAF